MNERERIHHAVDTRLSGLQGDPWLAQRVLAATKGEIRVKKKLSVGFVLVVILVLAAVTALAVALLTPRQLVEQVALPLATQSAGESYTLEETNTLLRLAQENGIELSANAREHIQSALQQGEGYFKEEMLMALAKAEFGENPSVWTLEQQKWFDDVCVAIGFIAEPEKAMPAGGEQAKIPVVQATNEYIYQTYDSAAPLSDPEQYQVGVQYINGDVDGEYPGMYWSINYWPLFLGGAEYWVYLRDDGTVLGDHRLSGIADATTVTDVLDSYRRYYGMEETWSQETLRSFQKALLLTPDTNAKAYLCLARMTYPDIPASAISREQAYDCAARHLGVNESMPPKTTFTFLGDTPNPVWKVEIARGEENWSLDIDCVTGEIKAQQLRDRFHAQWWSSITLWDVFNEVDATWVDDLPPSVG